VIRNVVLVSLDDVGANHVSAYGYARETTPHLDDVAREGLLFESAYTQQTWTLTSHLTMMTGLDPRAHGASPTRSVPPSVTTLAEVLWNHGFSTAAFTGAVAWMRPRYGLGRGFEVYEMGASDARLDAPRAVRWLARQARLREEDPEHRFFLFVHFFDAHSDAGTPLPYYLPDPGDFDPELYAPEGRRWGRRGGTEMLIRLVREGASEEDRTFATAYYDAGVRYVDEYGVGPIVAALDEYGLAQDTLLVLTADHGEEIFEHGSVLHGFPHQETAHVPLVLRGPGIPRGARTPHLAALVDLMPTLLSLLGLPVPEDLQGRDLTPLLNGGGPVNEAVYTDGGHGASRAYPSMVVADVDGRRWSYLVAVEGQGDGLAPQPPGELYDMAEDAGQQHDLAGSEPELAARLERMLVARLREANALSRRLGGARESIGLSDEERRHLRELGYGEDGP
jgi:arylsulfatase